MKSFFAGRRTADRTKQFELATAELRPTDMPLTIKFEATEKMLNLPKYRSKSTEELMTEAWLQCKVHTVDRASAIAVLIGTKKI